MRVYKLALLAALTGSVAVAQAAPTTYTLDPAHTDVIFTWSHFGFSHPSGVAQISQGTVVFDDKDPARSSVQVTMPIKDFDTHVPTLNEEFQSAQFFDAAQYPDATFKSTSVKPLGGETYRVMGNLTLHGMTHAVTLDVHLNKQGAHPMSKKQSIGFDASGTLKRSDFGVKAYLPYVGDDIRLQITTEGKVGTGGA